VILSKSAPRATVSHFSEIRKSANPNCDRPSRLGASHPIVHIATVSHDTLASRGGRTHAGQTDRGDRAARPTIRANGSRSGTRLGFRRPREPRAAHAKRLLRKLARRISSAARVRGESPSAYFHFHPTAMAVMRSIDPRCRIADPADVSGRPRARPLPMPARGSAVTIIAVNQSSAIVS